VKTGYVSLFSLEPKRSTPSQFTPKEHVICSQWSACNVRKSWLVWVGSGQSLLTGGVCSCTLSRQGIRQSLSRHDLLIWIAAYQDLGDPVG